MYGKRKKMMYGGMTRSQKSSGGTPAKKMMDGGRVAYNKGGSTQPEYKSGDMPKCMPK
jgi:hypothetical protein